MNKMLENINLNSEDISRLHKEYEETVSTQYIDGVTKIVVANCLKVFEQNGLLIHGRRCDKKIAELIAEIKVLRKEVEF